MFSSFIPFRPTSSPQGLEKCWCRQKTAGRKTECGCGRGTGVWCGSCLNTRMGQNIDEISQMTDWTCPSCLEICNCSGRTCDRHNAHLGCTRILSGEAREQGYKSVSLSQLNMPRSDGTVFGVYNTQICHVQFASSLPHATVDKSLQHAICK